MQALNKTFLVAIMCGAVLAPAWSTATPIVSKEQAAEGRIKYLKQAREKMIALRDDADMVFIGRLADLAVRRETRQAEAGALARASEVDVHEAVFAPVDNIKGAYPRGQVLTYEISRTRVTIGGPMLLDTMPRTNGVGDSYLVYAKDGKILRTNRLPDTQPMDARAEAALLRGAE